MAHCQGVISRWLWPRFVPQGCIEPNGKRTSVHYARLILAIHFDAAKIMYVSADQVKKNSFYLNEELLQRSERCWILAVTFGPQLILDITGTFDSLKLSVLAY